MKKFFEQLTDEVNNIGRNLGTEDLPKLPKRELTYPVGSYGITELLACPIKAELRRKLAKQGIELPAEAQEIDDGYLFENLVKLALCKLYKDKFEPEKVLPFSVDGKQFKVNGHLDCFLDFDDKVVGIELKNTNLSFDNATTGRPEKLIILQPNDRSRVNVNIRYFNQAKLERYALKKLYPNKQVETYLLVKTNLRTKDKFGKSTIVLPVSEDFTDEEVQDICKAFLKDRKPRAGWECYLCNYKKHGYCKGKKTSKLSTLESDDNKLIEQLLDRRKQLLAEVSMTEQQLKRLISNSIEYTDDNGRSKKIGWLVKMSFEYDIPKLIELLEKKNLSSPDYFSLKRAKVRELEQKLGKDIEACRKKKFHKRFCL